MPNTIKHKRSSTLGLVPGTGSIDQAELAINIADGKLYTKNSNNTIINLGVTSISGSYITPNSGNFINNLTVSSIYLSNNSISSNSGSLILKPFQNSSLRASDSGEARGEGSVDFQMTRSTDTEVASGSHSVLTGGRLNTSSGADSVVCGGSGNLASSSGSSVLGGYNNASTGEGCSINGGANNSVESFYTAIGGGSYNTATAHSATVAGGFSNDATATNSTIGGGSTNTASGSDSTVSGGNSNVSSGGSSNICGGAGNVTYGSYSTVTGGSQAVAHQHGEEARSAGSFVVGGDAQIKRLLLRGKTTIANTTVLLTLDGALDTVPSNNSIISHHRYNPNDSAIQYTWLYNIKVVARNLSSAAPESAAFKFEGILESSSAAGVILLGNTKTIIYRDNASFDCNIYEFNTTSSVQNDGLYIEVSNTGYMQQDEDVYWLAYVEILELGITEYENIVY